MTEHTLTEALRKIHRPSGAGKLFSTLGYGPPRHAFPGTVPIASWKAFVVVGVKAEPGERKAIQVAARLASAGRYGLVVAIGRAQVGIVTPRLRASGVTRQFVVSIQQPDTAAVHTLARLTPRPGASALLHAIRVEEILDGEDAGARFFTGFRALLDRFETGVKRAAPPERRLAALLPLIRTLFLYFVQAKGWLENNPEYLRERFDAAVGSRRHFHRDVLDPLCYEILNRPPEQRRRRSPGIPYLNGGLFTIHPVEVRLGRQVFSNRTWRHAFEDLFDRFRFCLREGDAVDAIAPDMLGRVFERVMAAKTRRDTGTFYTPESIVDRVVTGAIEGSLRGTSNLAPPIVKRVVRCQPIDPALRRRARRAVDRLRIVDPAAGSGAFLLGALHRLTRIHLALLRRRGPGTVRALRHRILRHNLFGVDVDPIAVTLAELRLWLAIVADDPTRDVTEVEPLPNLDGVMRQGDSLIDPLGAVGGARRGVLRTGGPQLRDVASRRTALFVSRGASLASDVRALRVAERSLAVSLLTAAVGRVEADLHRQLTAARVPNLFGDRPRLTAGQRDALRESWTRRRALRAALRGAEEDILPFFSFDVHAPDVIGRGGFTTVIGNPPWVRAERLAPATRDALRRRFEWWQGESGRGFRHQPDLAVAFLARAFELTRPGGALAFVVPSKVFSAGYGERTRRHLVRETSIDLLCRVDQREAALFGATTYPTVIVARKSKPAPAQRTALAFDGSITVQQKSLVHPGPWRLVPSSVQRAVDALLSSGVPLGEVAAPALGIKTGSNDVFLGRVVEERGSLSVVQFGRETVTLESASLRPVVRGRDVRPFRAGTARSLIWAYHDGAARPATLPPRARRYLNRHRRILDGRSDHTGGDLATLFRLHAARSRHRVIWPDIAVTPAAVVLDCTDAHGAVPLNTCYVSAAPDRDMALAIAAVINSTWVAAFAVVAADEARGGYRRMNSRVMRQVPVPPLGATQRTLVRLSDEAHRTETVDQATLDGAVADALGLPSTVRATLARFAADHQR